MKKFVSIILAALVLTCFAACGTSDEPTLSVPDETSTVSEISSAVEEESSKEESSEVESEKEESSENENSENESSKAESEEDENSENESSKDENSEVESKEESTPTADTSDMSNPYTIDGLTIDLPDNYSLGEAFIGAEATAYPDTYPDTYECLTFSSTEADPYPEMYTEEACNTLYEGIFSAMDGMEYSGITDYSTIEISGYYTVKMSFSIFDDEDFSLTTDAYLIFTDEHTYSIAYYYWTGEYNDAVGESLDSIVITD